MTNKAYQSQIRKPLIYLDDYARGVVINTGVNSAQGAIDRATAAAVIKGAKIIVPPGIFKGNWLPPEGLEVEGCGYATQLLHPPYNETGWNQAVWSPLLAGLVGNTKLSKLRVNGNYLANLANGSLTVNGYSDAECHTGSGPNSYNNQFDHVEVFNYNFAAFHTAGYIPRWTYCRVIGPKIGGAFLTTYQADNEYLDIATRLHLNPNFSRDFGAPHGWINYGTDFCEGPVIDHPYGEGLRFSYIFIGGRDGEIISPLGRNCHRGESFCSTAQAVGTPSVGGTIGGIPYAAGIGGGVIGVGAAISTPTGAAQAATKWVISNPNYIKFDYNHATPVGAKTTGLEIDSCVDVLITNHRAEFVTGWSLSINNSLHVSLQGGALSAAGTAEVRINNSVDVSLDNVYLTDYVIGIDIDRFSITRISDYLKFTNLYMKTTNVAGVHYVNNSIAGESHMVSSDHQIDNTVRNGGFMPNTPRTGITVDAGGITVTAGGIAVTAGDVAVAAGLLSVIRNSAGNFAVTALNSSGSGGAARLRAGTTGADSILSVEDQAGNVKMVVAAGNGLTIFNTSDTSSGRRGLVALSEAAVVKQYLGLDGANDNLAFYNAALTKTILSLDTTIGQAVLNALVTTATDRLMLGFQEDGTNKFWLGMTGTDLLAIYNAAGTKAVVSVDPTVGQAVINALVTTATDRLMLGFQEDGTNKLWLGMTGTDLFGVYNAAGNVAYLTIDPTSGQTVHFSSLAGGNVAQLSTSITTGNRPMLSLQQAGTNKAHFGLDTSGNPVIFDANGTTILAGWTTSTGKALGAAGTPVALAPTMTQVGGGAIGLTTTDSFYLILGQWVFVNMDLVITSYATPAAGTVKITGIPSVIQPVLFSAAKVLGAALWYRTGLSWNAGVMIAVGATDWEMAIGVASTNYAGAGPPNFALAVGDHISFSGHWKIA